MFSKEPKNNKDFYWTNHIKRKMAYYGISEGRLRRIIKSPERVEKGIASDTIAVMQKTQTKRPNEIWLMYQIKGKKKRMISAWRYPGVSPKGEPIVVPEEILSELKNLIKPYHIAKEASS